MYLSTFLRFKFFEFLINMNETLVRKSAFIQNCGFFSMAKIESFKPHISDHDVQFV